MQAIGLPEVKVGVVPGAGGCVRLPRLVGLAQGLSLILAGKVVRAKAALAAGIVDALVPDETVTKKTIVAQ